MAPTYAPTIGRVTFSLAGIDDTPLSTIRRDIRDLVRTALRTAGATFGDVPFDIAFADDAIDLYLEVADHTVTDLDSDGATRRHTIDASLVVAVDHTTDSQLSAALVAIADDADLWPDYITGW